MKTSFNFYKIAVGFIVLVSFGLISCKKKQIDLPFPNFQKEIIVVDENDVVQANVSVTIYLTESDLLNDTLAIHTLTSNSEGRIAVNFEGDTLFAIAENNGLTSEFVSLFYLPESAQNKTTYKIKMKQPAKTQWLCGHGGKNWFMDGYTMNGAYSAYPVTSTLYEDGTWTDSNGRNGNWQFVNNETQLMYDYFGDGMNLTFDITEFNKDFIDLYFEQMGYSVQMSMTAVD